jgi:4-amino-4-deoxy-L-arabinose transferase-like glycosyltransferase
MPINILNKYSYKKLIFLFFFLSLLLRIVYGLYFFLKYGTSNFADDWAYIKFAEEMLRQGVFVNDISELTQTKSGITPFYPFIIFLSFKAFGFNYIPLIILNAVFSSLLTVIIYFIGKNLFNEKVGVLSSLWTIVYVNIIRWVPTLLKENLLQLLFALFVLCLIIYLIKNRSYIMLSLMSLVFALLIHTDERYSVYYIFLALVIFIVKGISFKQKLLSFIYLNILILIFMTPWLIRNYEVYKRPVILSERTAYLTDKFFGYNSGNYFSQEIQISDATLDSIIKGEPVQDITMYNLIQRGISYGSYPKKYSKIEKIYIDFKELWRPFRLSDMWVSEGYRPEGKWSFMHNITIIFTYGILLPFFIAGIYYSLKTKNKESLIVLGLVIMHTFIHITFILSQNRYRIPIDIIIIVFSFYGILQLLKYYSIRNH